MFTLDGLCGGGDQLAPGDDRLELLGHGLLHKLVPARDHDVHLAGLAGDDVDPQTVLAQEHLAPVCLLHGDGGGGPGHLDKDVEIV